MYTSLYSPGTGVEKNQEDESLIMIGRFLYLNCQSYVSGESFSTKYFHSFINIYGH